MRSVVVLTRYITASTKPHATLQPVPPPSQPALVHVRPQTLVDVGQAKQIHVSAT